MRLDIHVKFEHDEVKALLQQLTREIQNMSLLVDTVVQEVRESKDAITGMIALFKGIADRLIDAGQDKVKLDAVIASLQGDQDAIAAAEALVENTPADPNA